MSWRKEKDIRHGMFLGTCWGVEIHGMYEDFMEIIGDITARKLDIIGYNQQCIGDSRCFFTSSKCYFNGGWNGDLQR